MESLEANFAAKEAGLHERSLQGVYRPASFKQQLHVRTIKSLLVSYDNQFCCLCTDSEMDVDANPTLLGIDLCSQNLGKQKEE